MTELTAKRIYHARGSRGFTLVEVLVALTIILMASSALLLATHAAMDSSTDSLDQTIAQGIARQFLDEAMGMAYVEPGSNPLDFQLGPETGEDASAGRWVAFDDSDDYANYSVRRVVDPWGQNLGIGDDQGGMRHPHFRLNYNHFRNWKIESDVVYVDPDNPATPVGSASGTRAITVSVYKRAGQAPPRLLVTMRRVYSYVPAPQ